MVNDVEYAQALAACTGAVGVTVINENYDVDGNLVAKTVTANDFHRFAPTAEQVEFAVQYATKCELDGVFVGINCPGKEDGYWLFGQEVNPIMDPSLEGVFKVCEDRNDLWDILQPGDAYFRVCVDGYVGPAIEYIN